MTQLTILLSVDVEANRFRFFVVELRALEDGSAELHRRWGRIGTDGRHGVEHFSTVRLAEAARAELLERRRRRGYVRADLGAARERVRDGLDPLVTWEVMLAHALERMRRSITERREALRPRKQADAAQLALPLAG